MRVGVDATSWGNRRGYGRFTRNALERLVRLDGKTEYVFYVDEATATGPEIPTGVVTRHVRLSQAPAEAAAAHSHRSPVDLLRLSAAASRGRLDAFLFPTLYTFFPVVRIPTIVGVHDAITREYPELTLPSRRARLFWRAKEEIAIRRAARLFTVSQAARRMLASRLRIAPERIAVVPEAPDPVFRPQSPGEVDHALREVGLRPGEPFIVFAAGISPHKNLDTLLEALRAGGAAPARLVVAGELEADPFLSAASRLRELIETLGLRERAILPGFVSDETLAALYTAAAAAVVPSLSEGFGLPAVEAAACGAAPVLSDIPAHRETLGEAALFFPPTDADALRAHLDRLVSDAPLRRAVGERSRKAVAGMSWDTTAARLAELVTEAAGRRTRRA